MDLSLDQPTKLMSSHDCKLMSKNFPPLTLSEAQVFSVCEVYKAFTICIFAAGGGTREMYWGYIIYDCFGDRAFFNRLPRAKWEGATPISYSWDVPEGMAYCRDIVDRAQLLNLAESFTATEL